MHLFKWWTQVPGVFALATVVSIVTATVSCAADNSTLSVTQALDTALRNNPALAAYSFEIEAAEGRTLQASLRPNPELELAAENVSGDLPGARRAESTAEISQPLELGNKRSARIKKSRAECEVLRKEYEGLRLDLIAEVKRAFVALQGAQTRQELTQEGYRLVSELAASVTERVKAGAVSPIEETRAEVARSLAAADVDRATRELAEARQELAKAMGIATPFSSRADGELSQETSPPELGLLMEKLDRTPDLAKWELERASRDAALANERRLVIPDVSVIGGYRRLEESSENTFVLGLAVPLPLFNRNQGAIREAAARLAQAEQERRATEIDLQTRLARSHAEMVSALREVRALREGALVSAQRACDAVREGYDLGKFSYLDVLDASKALVESKERYLDALVTLNVARIEVERLIGGDLETSTAQTH